MAKLKVSPRSKSKKAVLPSQQTARPAVPEPADEKTFQDRIGNLRMGEAHCFPHDKFIDLMGKVFALESFLDITAQTADYDYLYYLLRPVVDSFYRMCDDMVD
ncbi:MAG TPA: hypothetical protein VGK99_21420 [Acidobacteriota bacterium]|jgi:hypothetical protein